MPITSIPRKLINAIAALTDSQLIEIIPGKNLVKVKEIFNAESKKPFYRLVSEFTIYSEDRQTLEGTQGISSSSRFADSDIPDQISLERKKVLKKERVLNASIDSFKYMLEYMDLTELHFESVFVRNRELPGLRFIEEYQEIYIAYDKLDGLNLPRYKLNSRKEVLEDYFTYFKKSRRMTI
jgi:hypothetical protein